MASAGVLRLALELNKQGEDFGRSYASHQAPFNEFDCNTISHLTISQIV